MRIEAAFQAEVGNWQGHSIGMVGGDRADFPSFTVEAQGIQVEIVPIISAAMIFSLDKKRVPSNKQASKKWYLDSLRATVARDVESVDLAETQFAKLFSEPALEALQRTLKHLRSITNDHRIDIYLSTLKLMLITVEGGEVIYDADSRSDDYEPTYSPHILTPDEWDKVARRSTENKRLLLGREMLLNARAFFESGNNTMAVVNAAMACEYFIGKIIEHCLTKDGRVEQSKAQSFAHDTSNRQLPTLLAYFGLVETGDMNSIMNTFAKRNDILHGPSRGASDLEVETAIASAQMLEKIYLPRGSV